MGQIQVDGSHAYYEADLRSSKQHTELQTALRCLSVRPSFPCLLQTRERKPKVIIRGLFLSHVSSFEVVKRSKITLQLYAIM